jgi:hypothetical protein
MDGPIENLATLNNRASASGFRTALLAQMDAPIENPATLNDGAEDIALTVKAKAALMDDKNT